MKKTIIYLTIFLISLIFCGVYSLKMAKAAEKNQLPAGINYLNPEAATYDHQLHGYVFNEKIAVIPGVKYQFITRLDALMMPNIDRLSYDDGADKPLVIKLDRHLKYQDVQYLYKEVSFNSPAITIKILPFDIHQTMLMEGEITNFTGYENWLGYYDLQDNRSIVVDLDRSTLSEIIHQVSSSLQLLINHDSYFILEEELFSNLHQVQSFEFTIFILKGHWHFRHYIQLSIQDFQAPSIKSELLVFEYGLKLTRELIIEKAQIEDNSPGELSINVTWNDVQADIRVIDQSNNFNAKIIPLRFVAHPLGALIQGPNEILRLLNERALSAEEVLAFYQVNPQRSDEQVTNMTLEGLAYDPTKLGKTNLNLKVQTLSQKEYNYPLALVVEESILPPVDLTLISLQTNTKNFLPSEQIIQVIIDNYQSSFESLTDLRLTFNEYSSHWQKPGHYQVYFEFSSNSVNYLGKITIEVRRNLEYLYYTIPLGLLLLGGITVVSLFIFRQKRKKS
ncbi:MAG: hypothetical protein LBV55_00570 [Acholeplasmatales bacterium]|jgi:hypothetical protein|nr:hypothetical protein [Acholeplasmatales bacterium]